jgi:hypothetical protein
VLYCGRAAAASNNFSVTDRNACRRHKKSHKHRRRLDRNYRVWCAPLALGSWGDAMNSSASILDGEDDDIFAEEISDAALEIAAATVRDRTASLTIAFCSGLDECPRHLPRLRARSM